MLIGRNLLSGKSDFWIMLETHDGHLFDESWAGKPFKGTQTEVDMYAEQLAIEAMSQGCPLKEIHIIAIKRSD